MRTNKTGRELVDILRHACPEIPVTHEGKATLRENGVVELLLSLLLPLVPQQLIQAWM